MKMLEILRRNQLASQEPEEEPLEELVQEWTLEDKLDFEEILKNNLGSLIEEWKPWWKDEKLLWPKTANPKALIEDMDHDQRPPVDDLLQDPSPSPAITKVPSLSQVPHQDLAYSFIDLLFSYVITCRTFNGDLDDEKEIFKLIISTSYILSVTPSPFVYNSITEVLELSRNRMMESGLLEDSFPIFTQDVIEILSNRTKIEAALSHLSLLLERKRSLSKKVIFFLSYLHILPDQVMNIFITGLEAKALGKENIVDEPVGNPDSKKILIQEL